MDGELAAWTLNYLTNRPQYMKRHDSVSGPSGNGIFLFKLYFTFNMSSCHLQKFSDDSATADCVSEEDELEYRPVIMDFVNATTCT